MQGGNTTFIKGRYISLLKAITKLWKKSPPSNCAQSNDGKLRSGDVTSGDVASNNVYGNDLHCNDLHGNDLHGNDLDGNDLPSIEFKIGEDDNLEPGPDTNKSCLPLLSSILFTIAISLLISASTIGPIRWWSLDGAVLISRTSAFVGAGILLITSIWAGLAHSHYSVKRLWRLLSPNIRTLTFLPWLIIASSWLTLSYNLLRGPSIRGEIILFALISFFVIKRVAWLRYIAYLPLVSAVFLILTFLNNADGRLLLSDDHSVFFYRLQLLKSFFPHIPFFNPLWNGGIDARDFFASGAHGVFILFYPLIQIFDLNGFYNILIISLLFILLPLSIFLSSRNIGLSRPVAAIAATLALCFSRVWFQWSLAYGTLGFVLSTILLPLVLSLISNLIDHTAPNSSRKVIAFFITASLLLCWTPAGIILAPAAIISLFNIRRILERPWMKFVAVLIPILHLPWIILFLQVSKVTSFVASNPTASHSFRNAKLIISFDSILKTFANSAVGTNPLIISLGLAGLYFIPKSSRLMIASTSAFLLFMGTVMVAVKPQLELDRMLVVLALLLTIPAAATIGKMIGLYYQDSVARCNSKISTNPRRASFLYLTSSLNLSLILGILVAGIFSTVAVISNRGLDHFWFKQPEVDKLVKLIRSEPGEGRGLFTGCVLHQLNEGHLAPLVLWTERPLIASSFVHNIWNYHQPIPKEFLARGDDGIEEFFDLYNIDYVFAHEHEWTERFKSQMHRYNFIGAAGRFTLFRRVRAGQGYVLEGAAKEIKQKIDEVTLIPQSRNLVLKFNYLPSLFSSACNLKPRDVHEGIKFIELTDCPLDTPVKIKMRPAYWRIFNG